MRFGLTFCEAEELHDVCSSVEIKENCTVSLIIQIVSEHLGSGLVV